VGFAACILIGAFCFTEKNVNAGFDHHKQIYRLYDTKNMRYDLNYDVNQELSSNFPEIVNTCPVEYVSGASFYLKDAESNVSTNIDQIISTDNNFFDIFSANVVQSVSNKPFAEKESFVITETLAKRLFKDGNALGKTLDLGNFFISFRGKVTAIIKDLPGNSSFKAEILMNSDNEKFRMFIACDKGTCIKLSHHFVQLKENTDISGLTQQLNRSLNHYHSSFGEFGNLALQPLDDIYFSSLPIEDMHARGSIKLLKIFLAIALLILLLSSINYLNYTVSMQFARLKTIGINKTNGAGTKQLLAFSFTEVIMGVFISLALSVIISILLLPYAETLFGKAISFDIIPLNQLLPVIIITITVIILLNSLAPLYMLSRFRITDFLAKKFTRKGKQFGKQTLLVFQLTISVILITAVLGIYKQLNYVKHADLGFNKERLLRLDIPGTFKNTDILKQELAKLPFISRIACSNGSPGKINYHMLSNSGDKSFAVNCITVGDDYLETMGIKLLQGRNFLSGDIDKACMMNETAVRQYGFNDFSGKRFNSGKEGGFEVIGVINNFHISSFYDDIAPVVLIYNPNVATSNISIKLLPGNIGNYIEQIKQVWGKSMPFDPMNYTFYDQQFKAMYSKEDKMAKSITFFSFIAILLTCMGILGQIFLVSVTRTKEIGIRKVNGARTAEVMAMLNSDFIKWVAIAFIIACPIAWYAMHQWLQNFAYKTELSWWVFALAGVLALAVALLTVSWQSWRAATRNPVESLRYE
jgi:putative ABC transport system permease protein